MTGQVNNMPNQRKKGRPLKGNSPLVTRMAFRISDPMRQEVEKICENNGITMSQFITKALEKQIQEESYSHLSEWERQQTILVNQIGKTDA